MDGEPLPMEAVDGPDGLVVRAEWAPDVCERCGGQLGPNRVLVGHQPCGCAGSMVGGGHRTWRCRACDHLMMWGRCYRSATDTDHRVDGP